MKWILLAMLVFSTQAGATLLKYTFDVETVDFSGSEPDIDRADLILLVDTTSREIRSVTYATKFFNIDFQGAAKITRRRWWPNDDGSSYYGIYGNINDITPSGLDFGMSFEAMMPIDGNPAHFLGSSQDNAFFFDAEDPVKLYTGYVQRAEMAVVPEPATLSLLFLGLAAIEIRRRLR